MLDHGTVESLTALLETARQSYAEHAVRQGLPLVVRQTRTVAREEGPFLTPVPEEIDENGIHYWPGMSFVGALNQEGQTALLELSRQLRGTFAGPRPEWLSLVLPLGSLEPPERTDEEYRRDREAYWWTALVFNLVSSYLRALTSLDAPDHVLAARMIGEFTDLILKRQIGWRTTVAMSGLDTSDDRVACGSIVVRWISAAEKGLLLEGRSFAPPDDFATTVHPRSLALPTHILEVTAVRPWETQPSNNPLFSAVVAFLLHGYELCVHGMAVSSYVPTWLAPITQMRPLRLDRHPAQSLGLSEPASSRGDCKGTRKIPFGDAGLAAGRCSAPLPPRLRAPR
jgi:hypothetical protein